MYSDYPITGERDYLIGMIAQKTIPLRAGASDDERREVHFERLERRRVCGWDELSLDILYEMVGVPDACME